jgi:fructokinase
MKFEEIYIYGEVLFDCFENGENKLGGAAFNVAWNLKGFGLNPKMISSIGDDFLGELVLDTMKKWQMDKSFINIISDKKTGSVSVSLNNNGIPTYVIEDDRAYDYIDIPKNINENSFVYHGSLALRNEYNQKKCLELKSKLNDNCFIDVNLRDPWWSGELLQDLLSHFKWLKINDDELPLLCESYGLNSMDEEESLNFILDKLDLELLILTKGSQGALLITKDKKQMKMPIVPVEKMADTVGAGDAFSSVVIYGLYNSWENDVILKRAMDFASKVCGLNGAITEDRNFYNSFLGEWEKESQAS